MWHDPDWSNVFDAALVVTGAVPAQVAERVPGGRAVYLATPYSREVVVRDGEWDIGLSVEASARAAVHVRRLMMHGVTAISPIVLSAEVAHVCRHTARAVDPLNATLWALWCRPILDACCAVVVPDIPGWQRSFGIRQEVERAMERHVRVFVYAQGAAETRRLRGDLVALEQAMAAQAVLIRYLVERIEILERGPVAAPVPPPVGPMGEWLGRKIVRDAIARVVADTGVPDHLILSEGRSKPVAQARQRVMYEAGQRGVPAAMIGRALDRDHSTVTSGQRAEAARRGLGAAA